MHARSMSIYLLLCLLPLLPLLRLQKLIPQTHVAARYVISSEGGGKAPGRRLGCRIVRRGDSIFLFGGADPTGCSNELWELTPWLEWKHVGVHGASPPPRYDHGCVYDAAFDSLLVFGGANADGNLGDFWRYSFGL